MIVIDLLEFQRLYYDAYYNIQTVKLSREKYFNDSGAHRLLGGVIET
jgi:hypothetical protein